MAPKIQILVDLNIVIDVIQNRAPFYNDSARVIDAVVQQEVTGWLAAHSLTTLYYLISRFRDRQTAVTALTSLLTSFFVAPVDDTVIRQALSWGWNDFEDAVQMAAAVSVKTDYIVTRNLKDFKSGPLPAIQPAALLSLLK